MGSIRQCHMQQDKGWALVTGASSGLGEALAEALALEGYSVLALARRLDRLEALAARVPGRIHPVVADLGTEEGLATALACTEGKALSLLVNNAGFGHFGPYEKLSAQQLRAMLLVNVVALAELTRALAPELAKRQGTVLQIASVAAFQPAPFFAAYGATKAFVLSLGEALWAEWRGRIRVVTLCPAGIATDFGEGEVAALQSTRAMEALAPVASVVQQALKALKQSGPTRFDGLRAFGLSVATRSLPRAWVARLGLFLFAPRA